MKPYGVRMSYRPGCTCCNTEHYHHFRGERKTELIKACQRAAKKKARKEARREIYEQLSGE